MKVIDYYDISNINNLLYDDKRVVDLFDDYFISKPSCYRINFDRNIKDLEILHVDEMIEKCSGLYDKDNNIIILKYMNSCVHEFLHMASNNKLGQSLSDIKFSDGLDEGLTEYIASLVSKNDVKTYYFEVLVASALSFISDGFIKNYFCFDKNEFISLFPNKKLMYNLLYPLSYYNQNFFCDYYFETMERCIKEVINSLFIMSDDLKYQLFILDSLNSYKIKESAGYFYKDYVDYAYNIVKEKNNGKKVLISK